MKDRTRKRNKDVEQKKSDKKDPWYSSFLINGGLVFIITLIGSYLVVLYERLELQSLDIPKEYAEVTFFNFVEYLEDLLLIVTPMLILILVFLFVFTERYFIFKKFKEDTTEVYSENSLKHRNLVIQTRSGIYIGLMLILFGNIGMKFLGHLEAFNGTLLLIGVTFLLSHFILWLVLIRDRGKQQKRGLTKYENVFKEIPFIFICFLLIPPGLIIGIFEYKIEDPIELIIEDNITIQKAANNEEYYHIKYLVTEKNGYSIWGDLNFKREEFDNEPTSENKRVHVRRGNIFEMRKIEDVNVKEVSFKIEVFREGSSGPKKYLYLENTKSIDSLTGLEEKTTQSKRQLFDLLEENKKMEMN